MKWMWLQNLVLANLRMSKRNAGSLLMGGKEKKGNVRFSGVAPW